MREIREIQADIDNIDVGLRALMEEVRDTSRPFDKDAVAKRQAEAMEKRAALCKELAAVKGAMSAPLKTADDKRSELYSLDAWRRVYYERRALEIGTITNPGLGAVNQVSELVQAIQDGDDILQKVTTFYGRDASTNIPVITPMDEPNALAESTTSISDVSLTISTTEIQPQAYGVVLPVSAEFLLMGAVDLQAQLSAIFTKAYQTKMHRAVLCGDGEGKNMKGIYTSALANTAGQTALAAASGSTVKITELAGLAIKVLGKSAPYTIVMSPGVYQTILSDSSTSEDVKIYKESLIRDKSIEGVPILLDAMAPAAQYKGDAAVVAVPLSRYAIGVAQQLRIDTIQVVHSTLTYFQATMFFSGKQVSDSDIYSLALKGPARPTSD